jgi:hypothetical protein
MTEYQCPKCRLVNKDPQDVARKHCSFCDVFAEDLRGELVAELKGCEFARGLTRRDCFSVAFWTVKHHGNEQSRVVHGRVRDSWTGELVQHAWAETPGAGEYENDAGERIKLPLTVVVDYCQVDERARFMPRDMYYENAGVETTPPPKRYTLQQCMLLAVLYGNDGPWDDPGET